MIARPLTFALVLTVTCAAATAAKPTAANVLDTLAKSPPRLMLTARRLAELKALARTDKPLAKAVRDVIARADRCLRQRMLVRRLIGPRLLSVSREALRRAYALGLAWRWTGKRPYADKLRDNLLAVCAFKDWNPSHFLDTAEMSHAVGVGYDWIRDTLSEADGKRIVDGLIRHGLTPGVDRYTGRRRGWWIHSAFNWNQVCNCGLAIGALLTLGPYLYMSNTGIDLSQMTGDAPMDVGGVGFDPLIRVGIFLDHLLIIVVAVIAATMAAGLYPAWRAGRVAPVETIRLV